MVLIIWRNGMIKTGRFHCLEFTPCTPDPKVMVSNPALGYYSETESSRFLLKVKRKLVLPSNSKGSYKG